MWFVFCSVVLVVGINTGLCSNASDTKSMQKAKMKEVTFRDDGRCGKKFPLLSGRPSECNPKSNAPCCSAHGWCGIGNEFCTCTKCKDCREVQPDLRCRFSFGDGKREGTDVIVTKLPFKTESQCVDICLESAQLHPDINGVAVQYENEDVVECWCEQLVTAIDHGVNVTRFCMLQKQGYVCSDTPAKPVRRCGPVGIDEGICTEVLGCCYKVDFDDAVFPKCFHGNKLKSTAEGDGSGESDQSGTTRNNGESDETQRISNSMAMIRNALRNNDLHISLDDGSSEFHTRLIREWNEFKKKCEQREDCKVELSDAAVNFEKAATGLDMLSGFSEAVAGVLKDKHKNFRKLLQAIGPFLGALGPAASLVSLILATDSPEFQAIQQLTKMVDVGFAQVEDRLVKMEQMITTVSAQIDAIQSRNIIQEEIIRITRAKDALQMVKTSNIRGNARKGKLNEFVRDSALFNSITTTKGIIDGTRSLQSTTYCIDLARASAVDRNEIILQLTRVFNFMLIGASTYIQIQLSLGHDKAYPRLYRAEFNQLNSTLHDVIVEIEECDNDITNNLWKNQWKLEIQEAVGERADTKDRENAVATSLFNHLSNKYSWRIWMVWAIPRGLTSPNDFSFSCIPDAEYYEKHEGDIGGNYKLYIINLETPREIPYHHLEDMEMNRHNRLTAEQIKDKSHDSVVNWYTVFGFGYEDITANIGRCWGAVQSKAKVQYTPGYYTSNFTSQNEVSSFTCYGGVGSRGTCITRTRPVPNFEVFEWGLVG